MNRYQCKAGKGNLHSPEEGQGAGLKRLRNWVRQYDDIYVVQGKDFVQPFRFSVAPDTAHWPHIKIEEARGLPSDLSACAYEIRLEIDTQGAPEFWIEAGGQRFRWLKEGGVLSCGEDSIPVAQGAQGISLRLVLDRGSIEVFTPGSDCVLAVEGKEGPGEAIAFSVPRHSIHIRRMTIYGLRSIFDDSGSAQERPGGKLLYESRSYSIYSDGVADRVYGEPHAIVPNRDTILSPQRVTETFSWGYPYLDMTRVVDREDEWHPNPGIGRFLDIHTGHDVFDAACRVALDIFFRCSSGEFSLKGQEGMWQGGFFQGAGMGFGVWVRDTAHIAMRAGNLIDPQVAKRSLRYTVDAGFDNAADGTAMPIIGIYDYVLATGDTGLATEAWPQLVRRMEQLEASFDKDACLIPAPQSTSNDAFEEPENGGYALSTEICFLYFIHPGYNDDPCSGEFSFDNAGKFEPVHARHIDIQENNIRGALQNLFQPLDAILGFLHHVETELIPFDALFDGVAHHFVVVNNKDVIRLLQVCQMIIHCHSLIYSAFNIFMLSGVAPFFIFFSDYVYIIPFNDTWKYVTISCSCAGDGIGMFCTVRALSNRQSPSYSETPSL